MRLSQIFTQESDKVVSIRCDICGYAYTPQESPFNPSKMIHIEHAFGYESAYFGDMSELKIDICEKCLYDWVKSHGLYPSVIAPYYH